MGRNSETITSAKWGVGLLATVLIFAPLIRGGNRPIALLCIELAALGLLLLTFIRWPYLSKMSRGVLVFLTGLVAVPVMQLVPLPYDVAHQLSGHEIYAQVLQATGIQYVRSVLSIVPMATEDALLTLLPPLSVFLLVMSLDSRDVKRIMGVFMAVVSLQAILGLMQFGAGEDSLLYLGLEGSGAGVSGMGTYANRNHFAGLMEMALPTAMALLASAVFGLNQGNHRRHLSRRASVLLHMKNWVRSELMLNRTMLYACLTVAVLLAGAFSRSRTGVALLMLGLLLTFLVLVRNFGKSFSRNIAGVVVALGVVLSSIIGMAPIYERFSADPLQNERWAIFSGSIDGLASFFPFGSGVGTYPYAMRAFQPDGMSGFVNHAHNDYIEWLFEGGAIAGVLLLIFIILYLLRWRALWGVRNWHTLHMMQVGSGLGVSLILLHGLTDFNLRIPANIIYAAFLAGVFFHPGDDEYPRHSHSRRRHSEDTEVAPKDDIGADDATVLSLVSTAPAPTLGTAAIQGLRNPFDT